MATVTAFSDADPDDPREFYVAPVSAVAFLDERGAVVLDGAHFLSTELPPSCYPANLPFERRTDDVE